MSSSATIVTPTELSARVNGANTFYADLKKEEGKIYIIVCGQTGRFLAAAKKPETLYVVTNATEFHELANGMLYQPSDEKDFSKFVPLNQPSQAGIVETLRTAMVHPSCKIYYMGEKTGDAKDTSDAVIVQIKLGLESYADCDMIGDLKDALKSLGTPQSMEVLAAIIELPDTETKIVPATFMTGALIKSSLSEFAQSYLAISAAATSAMHEMVAADAKESAVYLPCGLIVTEYSGKTKSKAGDSVVDIVTYRFYLGDYCLADISISYVGGITSVLIAGASTTAINFPVPDEKLALLLRNYICNAEVPAAVFIMNICTDALHGLAGSNDRHMKHWDQIVPAMMDYNHFNPHLSAVEFWKSPAVIDCVAQSTRLEINIIPMAYSMLYDNGKIAEIMDVIATTSKAGKTVSPLKVICDADKDIKKQSTTSAALKVDLKMRNVGGPALLSMAGADSPMTIIMESVITCEQCRTSFIKSGTFCPEVVGDNPNVHNLRGLSQNKRVLCIEQLKKTGVVCRGGNECKWGLQCDFIHFSQDTGVMIPALFGAPRMTISLLLSIWGLSDDKGILAMLSAFKAMYGLACLEWIKPHGGTDPISETWRHGIPIIPPTPSRRFKGYVPKMKTD